MKKQQSKIAPGMVNMTTTIPRELDLELKRLAKESKMTRNAYIRTILEDVAKQKVVLISQGFRALAGGKVANPKRKYEPFISYDSGEGEVQ